MIHFAPGDHFSSLIGLAGVSVDLSIHPIGSSIEEVQQNPHLGTPMTSIDKVVHVVVVNAIFFVGVHITSISLTHYGSEG